jgi:hypothetical protein
VKSSDEVELLDGDGSDVNDGDDDIDDKDSDIDGDHYCEEERDYENEWVRKENGKLRPSNVIITKKLIKLVQIAFLMKYKN